MYQVEGIYEATDFNMAFGLPQEDDLLNFRCPNLDFLTPTKLTMEQACEIPVPMVVLTAIKAEE